MRLLIRCCFLEKKVNVQREVADPDPDPDLRYRRGDSYSSLVTMLNVPLKMACRRTRGYASISECHIIHAFADQRLRIRVRNSDGVEGGKGDLS